jgi:hypothetical protein
LDRKGLFPPLKFNAVAVAGGAEYLWLSARKAVSAGARIGEAAALTGGEDGALLTESLLETEVTEETEACLGTTGRLERKLCAVASALGGVT